MKRRIVIHNGHPGLLDPCTHEVVPHDRQLIVVDSPYWRYQIAQARVELVRELEDARAVADFHAKANDRRAAPADTANTVETSAPAPKRRKRKPAPTADITSPKTNDAEKKE